MILKKYDYIKSELKILKGNWDDDEKWYQVSLNIKNKYFEYNKTTESLQDFELKEIYSTLNEYIDNTTKENKELFFFEPDFRFRFYASTDEDNCKCEFIINLNSDQGISIGDSYSILLFDEEMVQLRDYIKEVLSQ